MNGRAIASTSAPPGRTGRVLAIICVSLLSFALTQSGKVAAPVSFQQLCGLTYTQFEAMDGDSLSRWIQERFQVAPSRAVKSDTYGEVLVYSWRQGTPSGEAWLYDGHLIAIWLHDVGDGPTFGQVVAELGTPEAIDRYVTRVEDTVYAVELHYPAKGLTLAESNWKRGYVTHIVLSERMEVNDVLCYRPGSYEDVLQYAFSIPPGDVSTFLQRQLAWPGFGTEIRLER